MTKPKRSRLHADAIAVLDEAIAKCEQSTEYTERAKAEGYTRAKQLLLAKRREAEVASRLNGHP
jgi:hypothetical protein